MKIQVEILQSHIDPVDKKTVVWRVDKSRTLEISTVKNETTIQQAREKLQELKATLSPNQKIRVLEYHNDDPDSKDRKPCKILYEG